MPPTGDLTPNLGMYPDEESNQWSFGSQAGDQSTEQHMPGHNHNCLFLFNWVYIEHAIRLSYVYMPIKIRYIKSKI